MTTPYLGQITMYAFNFAPKGWALCNGQLLSIQQNTALFSLLGTYYGGNGIQNFQLPNLQGRIPIHQGQGAGLSPYTIGQFGGEVNHTLKLTEIPSHSHVLSATTTTATTTEPAGAIFGAAPTYTSPATPIGLNSGTVGNTGSGQPHNNLQPLLVINFFIALTGIFPSRN